MLGLLRKLDFLRNLFGADESAARAKERLRLVLIQDQSNISSDLLNVLRHEMIGVVSRYLEIDLPHLEMGIERRDGAVALAASIPIVRIRKEGRTFIGSDSPDLAPGSDNTKIGAAVLLDSKNASGLSSEKEPASGAAATAQAETPGTRAKSSRNRRSRRQTR